MVLTRYVLQPHILRPKLNPDGTKFGVRLYLLIVNDDDRRDQLRAYTHTTAGYVALGVNNKWDPLNTDKKLQLTHTSRAYENEMDTWFVHLLGAGSLRDTGELYCVRCCTWLGLCMKNFSRGWHTSLRFFFEKPNIILVATRQNDALRSVDAWSAVRLRW